MFSLVRPREFFQELSRNTKLKFTLAWLTMGGLVVPAALLMSMGISEKYVLSLTLVGILPFQYAMFCIICWQKGRSPASSLESHEVKLALRQLLVSAPPSVPRFIYLGFPVTDEQALQDALREPFQTPPSSGEAPVFCREREDVDTPSELNYATYP